MSEFSNYLENAIIDHFFRGESVSAPATRYLALHSADPTDAASGQEIEGPGYERQSASFGPATNGVSTNNLQLEFSSSGDWNTATHFSIWDTGPSGSQGNMLMHSPLDSNIDVTGASQRVVFEVDSITITIT